MRRPSEQGAGLNRAAIAVATTLLLALIVVATVVYTRREPAPRAEAGHGRNAKAQRAALLHDVTVGAPSASPASVGEDGEPTEPSGDESAPEEEVDAVEETFPLRLYGTVTDAKSGEPVAEARVFVRLHDETLDEAHSNTGGAYSLVCAEAGPSWFEKEEMHLPGFGLDTAAQVVCRAPGYALASKSLSGHGDDTRELRIDFSLRPGASIAGRVTDAATGEGIAGAEVIPTSSDTSVLASLMPTAMGVNAGKTDDTGAYDLPNLKAGNYRVMVNAREQGYTFASSQAPVVSVEEGKLADHVDFALEKGGVVRGTVRGTNGEPLEEVRVNLTPVQIVNTAMTNMADLAALSDLITRTDGDGAYELAGLPYDTEFRVLAEKDDYAPASTEVFQLTRSRPDAVLDVALGKGSAVSGFVTYSDGSPASAVNVRLMPEFSEIVGGRLSEPKKATSDEKGAFRIERVAAGKFSVGAGLSEAAAFMPFAKPGERVAIVTDGLHDVTNVRLTLERPVVTEPRAPATGVIRGRVVQDKDGAAVGAVRVTAERTEGPKVSAGGFTDSGGLFELRKLEEGRYDVSVDAEQGVGRVESVALGDTVTVRLSAPSTVSGQVEDASGAPVADCTVQLTEPDPELGEEDLAKELSKFKPENLMEEMFGISGQSCATDAGGFFEFRPVATGTYVLKAKSATKGKAETESFSVQPGQSATGLTIRLTPGVVFAGTVEDASGRAVAGAAVSMVAERGGVMGMTARFLPDAMQMKESSATSDDSGRFQMPSVTPGTYTVKGTHGDFAPTSVPSVSVEEGENVSDFRLVMRQGGTAVGHVLESGQPLPGAMVQLMGGGTYMATTGADGAFEIRHIAPGAYLAQAIDMNRMMAGDMAAATGRQKRVEIGDGETVVIDFEPPPGAVPVTGVVHGASSRMTIISLRRAGGLAPEDINPLDFDAQIDQMGFQGGQAVAAPDGTFAMAGVEPGEYFLEVYSFEFNPMNPDYEQIAAMDRTPPIREVVVIEPNQPAHFELTLPPSPSEGAPN